MSRAEVVAAAGEDANPGAFGGPDPARCDELRPRSAPGVLVLIEDSVLTPPNSSKGDPMLMTALMAASMVGPAVVSEADDSTRITVLYDAFAERSDLLHCTGEFGFAELSRVFGTNYVCAGVGTTLRL